MSSEIPIMTYSEVLKAIASKENHLLIGNGFNYGLGVSTGYSDIFEIMIENNSLYKDARPLFEECNNDLELFIGKLEAKTKEDSPFLRKYVHNKIKLDFMEATHQIVKANIKNVYAENNEGIYMLLQNFSNYFTLNYDSFLYLLLLKYKPVENIEKNIIALQPTLPFISKENDILHNDIYTEIKNAREKGLLNIKIDNTTITKDLCKITKNHFKSEIKVYSDANQKNWKGKDINNAIDKILEEENRKNTIKKVDDGYRVSSLFSEDELMHTEMQNLFFIHGAFHIYREGEVHKKITQTSDKALYEKIEEVLNSDGKDIVCVFQTENKIDVINKDDYLKNCLNKLATLSGNMIIIGCSLSENDNHIFENINKSSIKTLYISTVPKEIEKTAKTTKKLFPDKKIHLFDAYTISYEVPKKESDALQ